MDQALSYGGGAPSGSHTLQGSTAYWLSSSTYTFWFAPASSSISTTSTGGATRNRLARCE